MKNFHENGSGECKENGPLAEKRGETETTKGVGRKTSQEIVKWNQMIALGFQTRARRQTSQASLRGNSQ